MSAKTTKMRPPKSVEALDEGTADDWSVDQLGRSYYLFCLEQAIFHVHQARTLVAGDVTDENHELPTIERLLLEAYEAA